MPRSVECNFFIIIYSHKKKLKQRNTEHKMQEVASSSPLVGPVLQNVTSQYDFLDFSGKYF